MIKVTHKIDKKRSRCEITINYDIEAIRRMKDRPQIYEVNDSRGEKIWDVKLEWWQHNNTYPWLGECILGSYGPEQETITLSDGHDHIAILKSLARLEKSLNDMKEAYNV